MDYIAHLNPVEQQVQALVVRVARVEEDAPICYQREIYGHFDTRGMRMTICTGRMRATEPWDLRRRINETLMHEAVHVAQACKGGQRYLSALGVKRTDMVLDQARYADLRLIVASDRRLASIDHEALYYQDKPSKVKYMIQKYCF